MPSPVNAETAAATSPAAAGPPLRADRTCSPRPRCARPRPRRPARSSARSSCGSGSRDPSSTSSTRSASRCARSARRTPSCSTSSDGRRIPAVSISRTGTPSRFTSSSRVSRVVPARGVTIARSRVSSRLNSEDLPTLGRPTMASDAPSRTMRPVWKPSSRVRHESQRAVDDPAQLLPRQVRFRFVHELDRGLAPGDALLQGFAQRGEPLRQRPLGLGEGDPRLVQRARLDQVAHRLGASQVDPAVPHRAVGELAGARRRRPRVHRRGEQLVQHRRAAVAPQLRRSARR